MIEIAILGTLKEGPMHGYELKKRLHEVVGARSAVSFGSIYPTLTRLERDGSVAAVPAPPTSPAVPATPMTGSFAGEAAAFRAGRRLVTRGPRNKKVYGITAVGDARLAALIADPGHDERSFSVKVAFCRFVDPGTRIGLLERRRAALEQRLGEGRQAMSERGDLDRYVRSLLEHDSDATERDIAWLDRLLSSERELLWDTRGETGDLAGLSTGLQPHRSASPPLAHEPPTSNAHRPAPHQPSNPDGYNPAQMADGGSR